MSGLPSALGLLPVYHAPVVHDSGCPILHFKAFSAAITFQRTEDPMCGTSATPDSKHHDHQNHRHRQPQPQNPSNSDAARIGPLHHSSCACSRFCHMSCSLEASDLLATAACDARSAPAANGPFRAADHPGKTSNNSENLRNSVL